MVGCLWSAEYFLRHTKRVRSDYLTSISGRSIGLVQSQTNRRDRTLAWKQTRLTTSTNTWACTGVEPANRMEELAWRKDSGMSGQAVSNRCDRYYEKVFGILYDSARAGAPYAGSNFWAWVRRKRYEPDRIGARVIRSLVIRRRILRG